MNCPALVNSIGLLLDIIGVILLFCYGLPPDVDRHGRQFLTWGKDEGQARKGKRSGRTSRLTLDLLILGSRSRSSATGPTPLFSHASLLVGSLVRQQVNQPALVSLTGELSLNVRDQSSLDKHSGVATVHAAMTSQNNR